MRSPWKSWLILGLLLGTMAYALAEDLTLVTYYPSPRGRYKEIIVDTLTLAPPGNLSVPGSLAVGPTYPPSGVPGQVNVEGGVHIGSSVALPPATKLAVQDGVVSLVNADVEMELNHGLWFDPGHTTGLWSRPGASNLTLVTGGADRVFLTDVGRVGIGTPTPTATLEIAALNSASYLRLRNNAGHYLNVGGLGAVNTFEILNSPPNGYLGFQDFGTVVFLNSAGPATRVGIGTQTPQAMLDVAGTVRTNARYLGKLGKGSCYEQQVGQCNTTWRGTDINWCNDGDYVAGLWLWTDSSGDNEGYCFRLQCCQLQ